MIPWKKNYNVGTIINQINHPPDHHLYSWVIINHSQMGDLWHCFTHMLFIIHSRGSCRSSHGLSTGVWRTRGLRRAGAQIQVLGKGALMRRRTKHVLHYIICKLHIIYTIYNYIYIMCIIIYIMCIYIYMLLCVYIYICICILHSNIWPFYTYIYSVCIFIIYKICVLVLIYMYTHTRYSMSLRQHDVLLRTRTVLPVK